MTTGTGVASTHLLAEFVALLSRLDDEQTAVRAAAEHAAEAVEAEVGAVLLPHATMCVGFPVNQQPEDELWALAKVGQTSADVSGIGEIHTVSGPLDGSEPGYLLVGRVDAALEPDEVMLIRAMARVLSLNLEMRRTLSTERELRERSERQAAENARLLADVRTRQRVAEWLSAIELAISSGAALSSVLDKIAAGARDTLHADVACLRLTDIDRPGDLLLAAAAGLSAEDRERLRRIPLADGPPDQCGQPAAMLSTTAQPIHDNGDLVGILTVGRRAGKPFTYADQDVLAAFADHAGLALASAKTVSAMHAAMHDTLTGMASRSLFTDRLEHLLAAEDPSRIGLLFIDLDRFKPVNDTMGHAAGDALLVEVGQRIRECLNSKDVAARFGGDEFAALITGVRLDELVMVGHRISERLRAPFHLLGREVYISASVGVAAGVPGLTATEMLRNADIAMYQAKRRGEGHCEVFRPDMHSAMMSRLRLETDMSGVLARNEMILRYRPVVRLADRALSAVSVQAYWRHPEFGVITPAEFFPLAASTGMVKPVMRWCVEQTCARLAAWGRAGVPPVDLHLPVPREMVQDDDVMRIATDRHGRELLAAGRVVVVVEAATVADGGPELISRLRRLRAVGPRLAISGFGTDACSLRDLCAVPADLVTFEVGSHDEAPSGFPATVAGVARILGRTAGATAVHSDAQADALLAAGCSFGEGPLFGEDELTTDPDGVRGLAACGQPG